MPKSDNKALDQALASITKKHGSGALVKAKSPEKAVPLDVIPSGSLSLDLAIGYLGMNCGIPKGRLTEFSGPESSGKSTNALKAIANAQRAGDRAAYIDAEYSFDAGYATALGVNTKELYICEPEYGEQGIDIAQQLVRSGAFGIIVIDSVAALTPKAELEGEIGDAFVGLLPRMISQFLRQASSDVRQQNVAMVLINQLREKIGGFGHGPTTTTPGGRALKHYCSVRVSYRIVAMIKQGDTVVGARTNVKVEKNKLGPPKKEGQFDLMYGSGVSRAGELFDLGLKYGIIKKDGPIYSFDDERGWQRVKGREASKRYLVGATADKFETMIRLEAAKEVLGSEELSGDEEEPSDAAE